MDAPVGRIVQNVHYAFQGSVRVRWGVVHQAAGGRRGNARIAFVAVSMLCTVAIAQTNLKRMLAYSTISHVGFILLGFVGGDAVGYRAALFYTVSYVLMAAGSFGMIVLLSRHGFEADRLEDFKGLVACGGFSYGDVLGAGGGWAKSILFNGRARDTFGAFFARKDSFALGVCNGCQMLSNLGELIPGSEHWPRFVRNRSEQFEARVAMVQVGGRLAQRLQMAAAGAETAFGGLLVTHAGFQVLAQQIQAGAGSGRHAPGRAFRRAPRRAGRAGAARGLGRSTGSAARARADRRAHRSARRPPRRC